jgi:hypothetical protein
LETKTNKEKAMTDQEYLCKGLLSLGFTEYNSTYSFEGVRYFYKGRIEGPDCAVNSGPPSLNLVVYPQISEPINHAGSAIFQIFGALEDDNWVNYSLYAVPYHKVIPMIDEAREILGASWRAACETLGIMERRSDG